MNNKNIYLNEDEVNRVLESLNNKKEKLIAIIDKQKELVEDLHESWSGTSGDKAYEKLKIHEKKYERYLQEINVRINFLEEVKNAYIRLDNYLSKKIDDNSEIDA